MITAWVVVFAYTLLILLYSFACYRDHYTVVYTLWAPPPVEAVFEIKTQFYDHKTLPGKHSRFLVMVQTESCLTKHLKSEEAFGNTTFCQCDVLVLAFKTVCNEASPAHVKYVFKPDITWNEGRNVLLEVGRSRSEKYLYYIFIDDDIELTTVLSINPWRTFLDFLIDIEPAVGVIDFPENVLRGLYARARLGCGININSTDYINAPNFDSAFNAFHYQAIDYILPYPTEFDKISWWYSGFHSKIRSDIMFPGQTLVHTKINIINPQHRPYPRRMPEDDHNWNIIIREIEAPLPEKYRKSDLLKVWKRIGWINEDYSASNCFPLPTPHMPIRPFSYLKSTVYDNCSMLFLANCSNNTT